MRSPITIGDDQAFPGKSAFQTTFFSGPHSMGRPMAVDIPSFVGPRNSGQSEAERQDGKTQDKRDETAMKLRME
jgi:hypothetical protein